MRYQCGCKSLYGMNCPKCNDEQIKTCVICNCDCAVGPFEAKQMGELSSQALDRRHGIPADADLRKSGTTASNRESFGKILQNSMGVSVEPSI